MATKTRRQFLSDNFAAATSFAAAAALGSLGDRFAHGESLRSRPTLRPVKDETTGLPLLRLPPGFRYKSYGWAGETMTDGTPTPNMHDGMAVIAAEGDTIRLCRNHEISSDGPALHSSSCRPYDAQAQAGCTSLEFDTAKGEWLSSWVSFTGTSRNCAGGVTPWGTWLTAEETVLGIGDYDKYAGGAQRKFQKNHGWVFEVPGGKMGEAAPNAAPQPIIGMGRFVHEAIAVDRRTGIVYQTEDRATSGFYRYVPHKPGQLHAGGVLEIAEVVGQPDLRGGFNNGVEFDVRWHRIADPTLAHTPGTQDELGVFKQGQVQGASMFSRLEGCWFGDGVVIFDATSGGAAEAGQIWQYDPQADKLKLLFESPSKPTLNMPDNLCVSPRGGIVLCEDNDYGANEYPQRMFALSQHGQLALLAENNVRLDGQWNGISGDFRTKEWAGATFSPDGAWLFVNVQSPGITLAITGPWEDTLA